MHHILSATCSFTIQIPSLCFSLHPKIQKGVHLDIVQSDILQSGFMQPTDHNWILNMFWGQEDAALYRRLGALLRHCLMISADGEDRTEEFHR